MLTSFFTHNLKNKQLKRRKLYQPTNFKTTKKLTLPPKRFFTTFFSTISKTIEKKLENEVKEGPTYNANPTAWGINKVADGIETTTGMLTLGVDLGSCLAKSTIQNASQYAKTVLPENKQQSNSAVMSTLLQTSAAASSLGQNVLSTTTTLTSAASAVSGGTIGAFAGTAISNSIVTSLNKQLSSDPETEKALKRLAKVSVDSYSEVVNTVETAAEDLGETTKESVVDVVSHSLGQDSSEIVKNTFDTGKNVYKAVYKMKTFAAPAPKSSLLKNVTEATFKNTINELSKNN